MLGFLVVCADVESGRVRSEREKDADDAEQRRRYPRRDRRPQKR
jgi:hypothetical protein